MGPSADSPNDNIITRTQLLIYAIGRWPTPAAAHEGRSGKPLARESRAWCIPAPAVTGRGTGDEQTSIRLLTSDTEVTVIDRIAGDITQNLETDIGDFVIFRADGIAAYQLAVVVDDFLDNVTHVVRGADLVLSTSRQMYLQSRLHYPTPQYAHVPLVRDRDGGKISKSDGAHPLDPAQPLSALKAAWQFLRQIPMPEPVQDPELFWSHRRQDMVY